MAPPLRVQFSGALYDVTARSNECKPIFRYERDRPAQVRKYLSQYLCADVQARSAWRSSLSYAGRATEEPAKPGPPAFALSN